MNETQLIIMILLGIVAVAAIISDIRSINRIGGGE